MPRPALRPAMSPPRTAVPTIRASVLLAAIGMAASPGVAASPADPAGWAFSGDVRGGYFASERTERDGAESDAEDFNAWLRLAIERSLGERWNVSTWGAGRFSREQEGNDASRPAYAHTRTRPVLVDVTRYKAYPGEEGPRHGSES